MKYYAVTRGMVPGIYKTWIECSRNVTGIKGAQFKSFARIEEAQEYLLSNATSAPWETQDGNIHAQDSNQDTGHRNGQDRNGNSQDDAIEIYTDGACKSNGKKDCRAGYGVYFGQGDERNISKRLKGVVQSNNRAELMAVIEALKSISGKVQARIYTDSQYVQKGLEIWIFNWKKKNWKTSRGKDVLNQDLWKILDLEKCKKPLAQIVHVRGHAGIKGNEEADKLAVAGCFL